MNFRTHALALAVALVAMLLYTHQPRGSELHLANFALYGAVHALSVLLALETPVSAWRRASLIALAAVADMLIMYLGIFGVGLLAALPALARLYGALGACALFGAMGYGLLLRALLFPALRPRRIAQIALACLLVTLLAWGLATTLDTRALPWVIGAWWLAFSSGLWVVQRRFNALGTQAHP